MRKLLLLICIGGPLWAVTTKIQDSGCQNNTNQKVATLSSTVTAGHTIDFAIMLSNSTATVTVADNDTPSNTYTAILSSSNIGGGQTVKVFLFSAIAAHTVASLTITATTAATSSATCAFEWSDAFSTTPESSVSINNTTSPNVGCTSTGTAPNTTITPAATGDIILVATVSGAGGAGRVEHDKTGTDTTYGVGGAGGSGDNIPPVNVAGWGLTYKINAVASTTYTAGFGRVPNNSIVGVCSTVVRALASTATAIRHKVISQ